MTLKEIAEEAGVSTATVSLVMSDSSRISSKTKERVRKVIKEKGYRSNMLAGSLRKSRSGLIGILVEDITVPHTAFIIDGINRYAEEKNYNTILGNLRLQSKISSHFDEIEEYREGIQRSMETLLSLQVDGIIYIGMHDRRMENVLAGSDKPVVYCYCYTEDEKEASIRYDNEKVVNLLTREIVDLGHKRIAVINGAKGSEPAQLRFQGFCKALRDAKIDLPNNWNEQGNWNFQGGRNAAIRLLTGKDAGTKKDILPEELRPSVIVCMNDEMAVGVYTAAAELGLRIPEDLSVTGFDNADFAQHLVPPLTTVERPLHQMGYRALDLLIQRIQGEESEALNVTYSCKIIEGNSVADKKGEARKSL